MWKHTYRARAWPAISADFRRQGPSYGDCNEGDSDALRVGQGVTPFPSAHHA